MQQLVTHPATRDTRDLWPCSEPRPGPDHGRVTDALTEAPERSSPGRGRPTLWFIPIGLAILVLIIVGVIFLSGGSSGVTDQQQLASVQRACREWSGNSAASLGTSSASAACSTMADWMGQELQSGHMTGPMMWGSATTMDSVCRQWMGTDSRASVSTTSSPGWCDDMASWMEQHIGNDSMMHSDMMGGDSTRNGGGP